MATLRINKKADLINVNNVKISMIDYLAEASGTIHETNLYDLMDENLKSKILIPEIYLESIYNGDFKISVMIFFKDDIENTDEVVNFIKQMIDGNYGDEFKNQVIYLAKEPFTINFEQGNFEVSNV